MFTQQEIALERELIQQCMENVQKTSAYVSMAIELKCTGLFDNQDEARTKMALETHKQILNATDLADTALASVELTHEGLKENIQRASRAAAKFLVDFIKRIYNMVMGWLGLSKEKVETLSIKYDEFIKNAYKSDEIYLSAKLENGDTVPDNVIKSASERQITLLRDTDGKVLMSEQAFAEMQKLLSRKIKGDINYLSILSVDGYISSLGQHLDPMLRFGRNVLQAADQKELIQVVRDLKNIKTKEDVERYLTTVVGTSNKPGILTEHNQRITALVDMSAKVGGIIPVSKYVMPGNFRVSKASRTFCGSKWFEFMLVMNPEATNGKLIKAGMSNNQDYTGKLISKLKWPVVKQIEIPPLLKTLADIQTLNESFASLVDRCKKDTDVFSNDDGQSMNDLSAKLEVLAKDSINAENFTKLIRAVKEINPILMAYIGLASQMSLILSMYTKHIAEIITDMIDGYN